MGKRGAEDPGLCVHSVCAQTKNKLSLALIGASLEMESDWRDFGDMPVPEPISASGGEVH